MPPATGILDLAEDMAASFTAGQALDEDTLREEVSDPAALLGWCESHPEDPRTVAYLRMLGRLDEAAAAARATVFSGATRNSLVVLPLALALPAPLGLASTVVVAQTLVEVVGMIVLVLVVPRLVPAAVDPL
mgnify:CR=1 FL=1